MNSDLYEQHLDDQFWAAMSLLEEKGYDDDHVIFQYQEYGLSDVAIMELIEKAESIENSE